MSDEEGWKNFVAKGMGSRKKWNVTLMHHFCMDDLVNTAQSPDVFLGNMGKVAAQGGGNLHVRQVLHPGGKATNCGSALESLDVRPRLLARTSPLGKQLLTHFFGERDMDLSHVKTDGRLGFTVALEMEGANVMLSDPGSSDDFGPELLSDEDIDLCRGVDVVVVSDWCHNRKGTDLAARVFSLAKDAGVKTFFDPGDPTPKGAEEAMEVKRLKDELFELDLVDMLSVNEDEVNRFGGIDYLRDLCRVELHTSGYSQSIRGERKSQRVPSFHLHAIKRLTGAGDTWNAGDILGELLELDDEARLLLANATAGCYISKDAPVHPTRGEVMDFIGSVELNP